MPITLKDIREHREMYDLPDIETMRTDDYRQALKKEAFFWIDHHEFVRSTLSGEIFATNREQLDAMIEYLQGLREKIPMPPKRINEE